jgi:hypothetical protein
LTSDTWEFRMISHCKVCMYCHLERIGRKVNSQMKKKVQ